METTVATLVASVPIEGAGALGLAGALAAGAAPAVLGITDLIGGDDDDPGEEDAGGDGVFEDGDDLGGGDDLGDLGEFDDGGIGGFDDDADGLGGDGGDVSELENRLEELENEVASLSSSVNTVQNENEAVSETVAEVEGNVRDLLEIYEMVTRGVNPFVDDAASGAMGGDAGGEFGLFDGDGGGAEGDVDESIAEADAEEFFEDDFEEPGDDLADPDDAAVLGEGPDDALAGAEEGDGFPGAQDALDEAETALEDADDALGGADEAEGDDGGGGKSFEELKREYESGDPDWDVDDPTADDGDSAPAEDDAAGAPEDDDANEPLGDAYGGDAPEGGEPAEEPPTVPIDGGDETSGAPIGGDDDGPADVAPAGDDADPERDAADGERGTADDEHQAEDDGEFEFVGGREDDGRLYLRELPGGYLADLTALEWLEYLIGVGGTGGARDALGYYVDVGWIAPAVEEDLRAFLDGIHVSGPTDGRPEPGGLARFDPEHHRRSLGYVARLAGDGERGAVLDRLDGPPAAAPRDAPGATAHPVADGGDAGPSTAGEARSADGAGPTDPDPTGGDAGGV